MSLPSVKYDLLTVDADQLGQHVAHSIGICNTKHSPVVEVFFVYGENKVSLPQLRYYWGVVLEDIADQTGLWPDELHDAHKAKFGLKTTYLFEDTAHEMIKGLSKMGRQRATQFIDRVVNYWSEKGIIIREPDSLTRAEIIEALLAEPQD